MRAFVRFEFRPMNYAWRQWLWKALTVGNKPKRGPRRPILELEALELRTLPAGIWTQLTNLAPSTIGTMLLLPDGTVMAQGGGITNTWFKLTPNSSGSYINGTWSQLASMSLQR